MSRFATILGHQMQIQANGIILPSSFTLYPVPGDPKIPKITKEPKLVNPAAYGARLRQNKAILVQAMQRKNISLERQALMMGMAMQETNTLSPSERDWTKDYKGGIAPYENDADNYSIFNMNKDFITEVMPGANLGLLNDSKVLNDAGGLDLAVAILDKAFSREDWGIVCGLGPYVDALNFHRGGRTGLMNPLSYGCPNYRGAMQEMLRQIDRNPQLMSNEYRVWIDVKYV